MKPGELTGILLAGGRSTRFGGDKTTIKLGGRTVLQSLLDLYQRQFSATLLVVDRQDRIEEPGVRIEVDRIPGCGPLGGLLTGLAAMESEYAFLGACDMPFLDDRLVAQLCEAHRGEDVLVPRTADGAEPLAAIYSRRVIPAVMSAIKRDERRLVSFFHQVQVSHLDLDQTRSPEELQMLFFNVNTRQDLSRARQWAEE